MAKHLEGEQGRLQGNGKQVVLASSSPRRAALLAQLGIGFVVIEPHVEEVPKVGETPLQYAARVAEDKARRVASKVPELPVLAADTVVVCDGRVLGKPRSREDGLAMLELLSGRQHRVITAVTVGRGGDFRTRVAETLVDFRRLTTKEREDYWETGEPQDKAGGYGIQGLGAIFVTAIAGSYSGVVGLPLAETAQLLREFGIDCLKAERSA